ncbi:MAG: MFS transporter [Kofleriaceae bacterium]
MTAAPRRSGKELLLLLGVVSLLADLCYEGVRSGVGPYLALWGASAATVGFVAGLGELIGYGLRYVTGVVADRTGQYWRLTVIGYGVTFLAAPLLAIAPSLPAVAAAIALERLGKAIRSPAKATLTSFAVTELGAGKGFAIHEAMDQVGAISGPLVVTAVLAWRGDDLAGFAVAFAVLAIPGLLAMATLALARARFPDPRALVAAAPMPAAVDERRFRIYLVGVALIAVGLADWPLLAYHLERTQALPTTWLPVVYAGAMAADAVAALVIGWRFDAARARGRSGISLLAWAMIPTAAAAPLVWLGGDLGLAAPLVGVALWAMGLAATESIAKAVVATLVAPARRGRAYGVYYLVFGAAWWVGSLGLGALYDLRPALAAAQSTIALMAAAVVLGWRVDQPPARRAHIN